jgi:hypothetical protein
MLTPEQRKRYRANFAARVCDCGRVAAAFYSSRFVCARCLGLDMQRSYHERHEAEKRRQEFPSGPTRLEIMWENNWIVDGWEKPVHIGYGSLEILERKLATIK